MSVPKITRITLKDVCVLGKHRQKPRGSGVPFWEGVLLAMLCEPLRALEFRVHGTLS